MARRQRSPRGARGKGLVAQAAAQCGVDGRGWSATQVPPKSTRPRLRRGEDYDLEELSHALDELAEARALPDGELLSHPTRVHFDAEARRVRDVNPLAQLRVDERLVEVEDERVRLALARPPGEDRAPAPVRGDAAAAGGERDVGAPRRPARSAVESASAHLSTDGRVLMK